MIFITSASVVVVSSLGITYWMNLQKQQKKASTAFKIKYSVLYNLLTQRRKTEIKKVQADTITVSIKINRDFHLLTLEELDERLLISWKLKSKEYGSCTKEWSFNPQHSQSWMYEEILHDIRAIQLSKIRSDRNAEKMKLRAA